MKKEKKERKKVQRNRFQHKTPIPLPPPPSTAATATNASTSASTEISMLVEQHGYCPQPKSRAKKIIKSHEALCSSISARSVYSMIPLVYQLTAVGADTGLCGCVSVCVCVHETRLWGELPAKQNTTLQQFQALVSRLEVSLHCPHPPTPTPLLCVCVSDLSVKDRL